MHDRGLVDKMHSWESDKAASLTIWYLGQAGFAFMGNRGAIYIDPYLSDYVEKSGKFSPAVAQPRLVPSPLHPQDVTNAAAVLVTHNHADHLDPWSIGPIAESSPQAVFIAPYPAVSILRDLGISQDRIVPADDGDVLDVAGVSVRPVASPHEVRELQDEHHSFVGYVMDFNTIRVYHAGDCVADDMLVDQLRALQPDVVCLPINGRDWLRKQRGIQRGNMNFREAADLAAAVDAKLVIPMHYDVMEVNSENPAYLVDYILRTYPELDFRLLRPGGGLVYRQADA